MKSELLLNHPLFHTHSKEFFHIMVEHVLNRPTWKVDRPITVDSTTLRNTALRLLKPWRLLVMPPDHVGVLIHP